MAIPPGSGARPGSGLPGNKFVGAHLFPHPDQRTFKGIILKNEDLLPSPQSYPLAIIEMVNMRIVPVSTFLALMLAAPATLAKDLVLTSPPRESEEKARQIFLPIADYLTRTLGRPVVYKYSDNWLTYQSEMQKDLYDRW
jgi:hypothetical protein